MAIGHAKGRSRPGIRTWTGAGSPPFFLLLCLRFRWGSAFWKTNGYAPFPIWLRLSGHEWAKAVGKKPGFLSSPGQRIPWLCRPQALQKVCNRLGPGAVTSFFWRWLRRLPCPSVVADWRAGYVYEIRCPAIRSVGHLRLRTTPKMDVCGLRE